VAAVETSGPSQEDFKIKSILFGFILGRGGVFGFQKYQVTPRRIDVE